MSAIKVALHGRLALSEVLRTAVRAAMEPDLFSKVVMSQPVVS